MTHAPLGQAFIAACAHVFRGPTEHFEAIDVTADQDLAEVQCLAEQAIARVDDGSGVLVMTDMYGATPCNIASQLIAGGNVEAVSGVSLPMLVRSLAYRDATLSKVRDKAITGGTEGVIYINADPCYAKR